MDNFDKVLDEIKAREVDMGIRIANLENCLNDAVNELCYHCGQYKNEFLGACDNCRWKKVKEGF